jgi:hypothetical protein
MTNEQAIKILNEQIDSLQWLNDSTHKTWLTQTKSEIKKIFGIGSEESFFLNSFSLVDPHSKNQVNLQLMMSRPTITDFLKRCIQTIERDKPIKSPAPVIQYVDRVKEVIKEVHVYPPKLNQFRVFINWIKRQDSLTLIGTLLGVLSLPFGLAWLLATNKGDIKNYDLRMEIKELKGDTTKMGIANRKLLDSIIKTTTPLDLTKSKTGSSTKGTQSKEKPDTTH